MMGVEAFDNVAKMREAVKLEQFATALPTDVHSWVIDHNPTNLTDAARIADEYAVLSKPFKVETAFSSSASYTIGKESSFRHFKRGAEKKSNFNRYSPDISCLGCGKTGHSLQTCRTQKPVATPISAVNEIPEIVLQNHFVNLIDSDSTEMHEPYRPFCAEVILSTTEGTQWSLILLRDTGAMQSLVSRERFLPSE